MDEFLEFALGFAVFSVTVGGLAIALSVSNAGIDYLVSAERTVNAINAQCGTQYEKLDYLRIGKNTMLIMCETRQKRIELR